MGGADASAQRARITSEVVTSTARTRPREMGSGRYLREHTMTTVPTDAYRGGAHRVRRHGEGSVTSSATKGSCSSGLDALLAVHVRQRQEGLALAKSSQR